MRRKQINDIIRGKVIISWLNNSESLNKKGGHRPAFFILHTHLGVAVNASLSSFKIPFNILLTSNLLNIVSYDAIINKEVNEMKKAITLTLDEQILAWAQEKAAEENRTLSNYIETLLIEEQKKD